MKKQLTPPQLLTLSFIFLIGTGTVLLKLPYSARPHLTWLEAFFTSASAVCVTGLTVIDVGSRLTSFGQWVLLVLIQLGGLGLMSFSVATLYLLRGVSSIAGRDAIKSTFSPHEMLEVKNLLRKVFLYTFSIEAAGAGVFF